MTSSAYAHSLENKSPEYWQPLESHLKQVAELGASFARALDAEKWGRTLGALHDIGKYRPEFQDKLIQQSSRRVDHKSIGAKLADESPGGPGKLMRYCIAGHHGGLPNFGYLGTDGSASLAEILKKAAPLPPEIANPIDGKNTLELPFHATSAFELAFFTRMLFSVLVDADFLDTERFMDPEKATARQSGPFLQKLNHLLSNRLNQFSTGGHINTLRAEILAHCKKNAALDPGFFSLTVPTGGGKTLSSMAFALNHAIKHGLRRVVYVIPYTSIIEQNARVFRDIFPPGTVVEHQSNFDGFSDTNGEDQFGSGLRHRLACENWDAPVIVTTNVQFFESLYAAKPSRCRKLHNLAKSVIILDEAQMLPVEYLEPCMRALEGLVHICGSSVVLCTATQPALKKRSEFSNGLANIREIAPDPNRVHKKLIRTFLENLGELSLEEVAALFQSKRQILCIVNTRKRAGELFSQIRNEPGARHLSAMMCPTHRFAALTEIRGMLQNNCDCRVVSTQLIEAGVDISFPEVIREMAGLDSIAQAAGRCNREGEIQGLGKVSVFMPKEGLAPAFAQAGANTRATLRHYGQDPFSPETMEYFFSETYWLKKEFLDKKGILSEFKNPRPEWAFRDVAQRFRFIENNMMPVIIPYDENADGHIQRLRYAQFRGGILRRLQQYSVQIYPHQLSALDRAGAIELIDDSYAVLSRREFYDDQIGLCVPEEQPEPADFIF